MSTLITPQPNVCITRDGWAQINNLPLNQKGHYAQISFNENFVSALVHNSEGKIVGPNAIGYAGKKNIALGFNKILMQLGQKGADGELLRGLIHRGQRLLAELKNVK